MPVGISEGSELAEPGIHGQAPQPRGIVIGIIMRKRALPAELADDPLVGTRRYAALPLSLVMSAAYENGSEQK